MYLRWHDLRDAERVMHMEEDIPLSVIVPDNRSIFHVSPIHAMVDAYSERDGVYDATGSAKLSLTCACVRCLTPVNVEVEASLEERFVAPERGNSSDEEDVLVAEGEGVLLDPWIEQAVVLEIPVLPLCEPDCKGLCPNCGARLNEGPCGCDVEPTDARWDALAEMFDDEDE